jgi:1-deoxy-D-xylulose-5-phosphate synthase
MIPNMVVGAPADADELCAMIETALDHPGPIAIRFPKAAGSALPTLPVPALPVGRWDEVRPGTDVMVLAVGRMVEPALKAAIGLESEGISCRVINARWVKPLDPRIVEWAADHELVLTVEDNVVSGGFGAAVLEALSAHGMAGRVRMLGIGDDFLPAGSADEVLHTAGLDVEGITSRIMELTRS